MRKSGLTLVAVLLLAVLAGCAGQCPQLSGGILYVRQENFGKAAEMLEEAVQIEPDNWKSHYYLARAYMGLGRHADAYLHFAKAKELDPGNTEVEQRHYACWYDRFMPGVTALKAKSYDEAETLFLAAIEIDPTRTDAYSNLAFSYSRTGEMEKSIEWYDRLLEVEPDNADALEAKGQVQRALKRCDEAVVTWTRLLEVDPERTKVWRDIAECYTEIEDTDNALRAFEKARGAMPEDASIPFGMGVMYYKENDYAQAATYFQMAAEASDPGDGLYRDALFNRAQMQVRLEDFEGALETILQLIEAKDDVPEYYDLAGRIYFRLGNQEEGMKMFEKAKGLEDQP